MKRRALWTVAIVAWALMLLASFGLLMFHEYQGRAKDSAPPTRWPQGSRLQRDGRPTLVMMAHPYCACTPASLQELAAVMARASDKVHVYVLFLQLSELGASWSHTRTWDQAAAIPGVTVLEDRDGEESKRFRVSVSGETVLYDAAGALRFHGGITPSRAHAGDNLGRQRVLAVLQGGAADRDTHDAWGCSLSTPDTVGRPVQLPEQVASVPVVAPATKAVCSACHTVEGSS